LDNNLLTSHTDFNGRGAGVFDYFYDYQIYPNVATVGSHTLKMVIDPFNVIAETNESDNTYSATYTWVAPDMIVQNMTYSPQYPVKGQQVDVAVTIKNQGTYATQANFRTDFYKNLGSPPYQGQGATD